MSLCFMIIGGEVQNSNENSVIYKKTLFIKTNHCHNPSLIRCPTLQDQTDINLV